MPCKARWHQVLSDHHGSNELSMIVLSWTIIFGMEKGKKDRQSSKETLARVVE